MDIKPQNRYFGKKIIISLIIVAIAILFWSSAGLQKLFADSAIFTSQYLEQHQFMGVLVFFVISMLSAILSPLVIKSEKNLNFKVIIFNT